VRPAPFYGRVVAGEAFLLPFMAYGAQFSFRVFFSVVVDFFGRSHAGGLVGLLFVTAGSMAAGDPRGAGFIYDRTGSYGPAWMGSAALHVVALGLLRWARPPRRLEPSL